MLNPADEAPYEAKHEGRDRVMGHDKERSDD
jgi:PleD family two-component response regulator